MHSPGFKLLIQSWEVKGRAGISIFIRSVLPSLNVTLTYAKVCKLLIYMQLRSKILMALVKSMPDQFIFLLIKKDKLVNENKMVPIFILTKLLEKSILEI